MSLVPLAEPPAYGRRREAPRITFAIPAFNRPQLLRETLASLAAQTGGHDYEVIVCDDGGSPETARVVAGFPADRVALYLNRPALGGVGNWNRCLQQARGRWVMILHEDDTLYPWYLDTVAARLRDGGQGAEAFRAEAAREYVEKLGMSPTVLAPIIAEYAEAF